MLDKYNVCSPNGFQQDTVNTNSQVGQMHNPSAGWLCLAAGERVPALAAGGLMLLAGAGMGLGLGLGFVLRAALITRGWFCSC